MLHIIGFSHHYGKLHGQLAGYLLSVTPITIDKNFPLEGMEYDTAYIVPGTDGLGNIPVFDRYWIPDGRYLQLVFMGDKQIPFTTYRKIPANYIPWQNRHPRCYKKSVPYSDLIGQSFAFKFKGEKMPKFLLPLLDKNPVKIFK